ncbi:MAG: acetyl-CoA carboxylase carboxyl transferase subunit alpha, partial [Flavobacteriaceae bacterium]
MQAKLVDCIVPEPKGGAHNDREATFAAVKKEVLKAYRRLSKIDPNARVHQRRKKFLKMGVYEG